nr:MAG TPA: hypothetical protein [Caudoviricetes sp.]DAG78857.1 MAG TPA: hypothetical protein [Caudoviricetes sp.]
MSRARSGPLNSRVAKPPVQSSNPARITPGAISKIAISQRQSKIVFRSFRFI